MVHTPFGQQCSVSLGAVTCPCGMGFRDVRQGANQGQKVHDNLWIHHLLSSEGAAQAGTVTQGIITASRLQEQLHIRYPADHSLGCRIVPSAPAVSIASLYQAWLLRLGVGGRIKVLGWFGFVLFCF